MRDVVPRPPELGFDDLAAQDQCLAVGRRLDPERRAFEQLDAELGLELADAPAQRGLRQAQLLSGLPQAPAFRCAHERGQLVKLHAASGDNSRLSQYVTFL